MANAVVPDDQHIVVVEIVAVDEETKNSFGFRVLVALAGMGFLSFFSIMLRLVTNPEASSAKPPEEASAKIRSGWRIEAILRISINCHIYKPAEAF